MKKIIVVLSLTFMTYSLSVTAAISTPERVTKIEQELTTLKKAVNSESLADRISVSGFFTGKIGVANNKAGYNDYDNNVNFSEGSKIGIQATFLLTEKTRIISQLIARGKDDWQAEMEWAFLSHDFENGFTARIGRLRVPVYMYSDYLEVGYAQPWATPPSELYGIVPLTSFDGGDVIYETNFGDTSVMLQTSYGHLSHDDVDSFGELEYNNIAGASALLGYEDWTFRTTYYQTTVDSKTASSLLVFDNDKAYFAGLGLGYDNGVLLVASEVAISDVEGKYSDTESGYLTVGYRIGDFTPYISYAFLQTTDDGERKAVDALSTAQKAAFNWQRDAYSIGLRYDIIANLSIKLDATYTDGFGSTSGGITENINPVTGKQVESNSILYTVSFDAVF